MQKFCIVLAGPTAVGKTDLAIEIARYFHTEIISADSRQCFSELNIGVARPNASQLAAVPHHFIADRSVTEKVTAATFEHFVLAKIAELFTDKDVVVISGGTGLYIKAFLEGLDHLPDADPEIRMKFQKEFDTGGVERLLELIRIHDPAFLTTAHMHNPRRLMRALEVKVQTGQSILEFHQHTTQVRAFIPIQICLYRNKPELDARINLRVEDMIQNGLVEEVRNALPYQHLNALQTVGYKEMFDYLNGKSSLTEATELIKIHTRQYAKRQMTWFKKQTGMHMMHPGENVLAFILNQMKTLKI